jgi:Glutamine amidotransferase domain
MANGDKTVWLTYNGEIYSFHELRRLLAARGHVFASHCDGASQARSAGAIAATIAGRVAMLQGLPCHDRATAHLRPT